MGAAWRFSAPGGTTGGAPDSCDDWPQRFLLTRP